jgi:predicted Zn-dependent peptidase
VETKIEAVTPDDIARVAREYLSLAKGVQIYETPTLTSTQFYILLTVLTVLLLSFMLYLYLQAHSRIRTRK